MFGNLQQQGDKNSNHNLFNFFSWFQGDTEFGYTVDFLDSDFSADFTYGDAFDFDSISSGSFHLSFLLSDADVERSRERKKIMLVQILHAHQADTRNNA